MYEGSWKKAEPKPDFIPGLMRLCALQGKLRPGVIYVA